MNLTKIVSLFTLLVFASTPVWAAATYVIDMSHTSVGFKVSHMVIATVQGKFTEFTGSIVYDEKDIKTWKIKGDIQVASIDTSDEKRDNHLRSPDFFDAKKFPQITFESSSITKKGDKYLAKGTLTMRGVTKEVQIPFIVKGPIKDPWGGMRIGLEGSITINRQDFGVSWNKNLDAGGLLVGNDVQISLLVEAINK